MAKRPVVQDLNTAPEISPQASPIDNFQYVHPAQYKASLIDFSQIFGNITQGVAGLTTGNDQKNAELGAADFEKALAEAEDGVNTQAEAFAKAVSKGLISETNNPAYTTGAAKAAARAWAGRFLFTGNAYNKTGIDASAQPNPQTGIAPIITSQPPAITGHTPGTVIENGRACWYDLSGRRH